MTVQYKGFSLSYTSKYSDVVVKFDGTRVYVAKNLEAAKMYCTKKAY